MLLVGLAAVGALALVLAARLLVLRRETFLLAERARGASVASVAVRALVESVPLVALAAAVGAAGARLLAPDPRGPGRSPRLVWWPRPRSRLAARGRGVRGLDGASAAREPRRPGAAARAPPGAPGDRRARARRGRRGGAGVGARSRAGADRHGRRRPAARRDARAARGRRDRPGRPPPPARSCAACPGSRPVGAALVPVVATARAGRTAGTRVPLLTLTVAVALVVFCGTTAVTVSAGQRTAADIVVGAQVRLDGDLDPEDVAVLRAPRRDGRRRCRRAGRADVRRTSGVKAG